MLRIFEVFWTVLKRPNRAMQRTASSPPRIRPQADRAAKGLLSVCQPPFRCAARFTGPAVADLVSGSMISRNHASLCAVFLVAFCLIGCERAADITKDDLLERTTHWKEPKVAIWYYTGSKDGHDYFRYHDLSVSELYRIRSGEIPLAYTFPYTTDRSKWTVMPWGPQAKPSQSHLARRCGELRKLSESLILCLVRW